MSPVGPDPKKEEVTSAQHLSNPSIIHRKGLVFFQTQRAKGAINQGMHESKVHSNEGSLQICIMNIYAHIPS
jgi:hypothetical protein